MNTILIAQPGMINQRTLKEQTALMIAVVNEHLACVECLLEKGADPDIINKDRETSLYKGNIVLSIYQPAPFVLLLI